MFVKRERSVGVRLQFTYHEMFCLFVGHKWSCAGVAS